jgi:hypothetical protein
MKPRLLGWRVASGSLAAGLAISLLGSHIAVPPAPLPQQPVLNVIASMPPNSGLREYLTLREQVIRDGMTALPAISNSRSREPIPTAGQHWLPAPSGPAEMNDGLPRGNSL